MRSQVQVGICLRPLVETEIDNGAKNVVEIVGRRLHFNNSNAPTGYDFECMFGPSNLQSRQVYDSMISPLIDNFFEGFTATVFAYGQTGSGKTYLMGSSLPSSGPPNDELDKEMVRPADDTDKENSSSIYEIPNVVLTQNNGIIPFSLDDIFRKKSQLQTEGATVQLEMSYMEIYQEECYDLLSFLTVQSKDCIKENCRKNNFKEKDQIVKNHGRPSNLEMRENSKGETVLEGLSTWPVANQVDVNRLLAAAAKARATGKTAMNARSSRSHAIATLSLRVTTNANRTISVSGPRRSASTSTIVTSKLHLVDLAGSERVGKTLATGECLREGVSINKGLLTLGKVVSALNEQQLQSANGVHVTAHVPYRESKLTRLLKDALGGNGMTVMLACCSPADTQFKETLDTLRFAGRAAAIVNNAKQNRDEISTELPPFVCYKCGAINPKKIDDGRNSLDSSEESSEGNGVPSRLSPKGMKRGRDGSIIDSNSVSSRESYSAIDLCENSPIVISSNPFGDSEEGSSDPYKDPFGERSNNHILDPHVEGSSNTFLLTALDTRGKEIMQLKRKLLRSDNEKADISQRYFRLEKKYEILEIELKGKGKGGKTKKKKNFLQRVASAVSCQTANKGEVYIPK